MKILIISQYFFPENFRINDFAYSLVKRGHDVTVLTGLPNYPKGKYFGDFKVLKREEMNGLQIIRVPLIPRFQSKGWQLAINYLSFLFSSLIFSPFLILKDKYDVVFTASYSPATVGITGVLISKIKKAKMALWVQDLWPESLTATGAIKSSFILYFFRSMSIWIYKRSDLILIQSMAFSQKIRKYGIDSSKIDFFPNWAEDLYKSVPEDHEDLRSTIASEKFIIMFAGNLGKAQSLGTIAKAAYLTKDREIQWVIVGDGREKSAFEEKINDLEIENVTFLGSFAVDKMPALFASADALLVTLKKDPIFSVTIPGKLQSYMLSEKPILASIDGEGAKVITESDCGFSVPSEDYQALASSAIELSQLSASRRKEMGLRGRQYYDLNFNREILIDKFENYFKD